MEPPSNSTTEPERVLILAIRFLPIVSASLKRSSLERGSFRCTGADWLSLMGETDETASPSASASAAGAPPPVSTARLAVGAASSVAATTIAAAAANQPTAAIRSVTRST